jgi:succinate dehydrogenase/fumarate reductase-like Fe-S protein
VSSEPRLRMDDECEATGEPIVVEIERQAPGSPSGLPPEVSVYTLHPSGRLNILGVFREIYFHLDPTFGFRNFECGRGICSTCNVFFEGRVQKGCRVPVPPGSRIRIGPQDPARTLRDVACAIGAEPDTDGE